MLYKNSIKNTYLHGLHHWLCWSRPYLALHFFILCPIQDTFTHINCEFMYIVVHMLNFYSSWLNTNSIYYPSMFNSSPKNSIIIIKIISVQQGDSQNRNFVNSSLFFPLLSFVIIRNYRLMKALL